MNKLFYLAFGIAACSQGFSENILWSAPEILSANGVDSIDPAIGMDANGSVITMWSEQGVIMTSSKTPNGSWSSPEAISNSDSTEPELFMDLNGNTTAIWIQGSSLAASSKPANGIWSAIEILDSSGVTSEPQIIGDTNGNVVVIWTNTGEIKSNTKLVNRGWAQNADILSSSPSDSPFVSIGSDGTVVAVWHTVLDGVDIIDFSMKDISIGIWSSPSPISLSSRYSTFPSTAVDANGNVLALWYASQGEISSSASVVVESALMPKGGTWSSPIVVSDSGIYDPNLLKARAIFDDSGKALALWTLGNPRSSSLQYSIYSGERSGTWSDPSYLVFQNPYAYSFSVNYISSSRALLSYMIFNGDSVTIWETEINISSNQQGFWTTPNLLSQSLLNGYPKTVGYVVGNGILAATVWISYDGMNTTIQASTGAGSLLQPPANLSVTEMMYNVGLFYVYANLIQWTPSVSPNVILYYIYRNGTYVATINGAITSYSDQNQLQDESVVYGVSSVDNQGFESEIAIVSFP